MRSHALVLMAVSLACFAWPGYCAENSCEDLIRASWKGDVSSVRFLLSKGVNVDGKTTYNATALQYASEQIGRAHV